jgi:AcrR family transcriptional regulator
MERNRMAHRNTHTRDHLLQIAASLFGSHGWEATTLNDILSAAGITKGAFYHYFPGKQALCEAAIDQAVSEIGLLLQSRDPRQSGRDQLDQLIARLEELNRSGQWTRFRLLVRLSADSCQSYPAIGARLRKFWTEFLREIQSLYSSEDTKDANDSPMGILHRLAGSVMLERYVPGG